MGGRSAVRTAAVPVDLSFESVTDFYLLSVTVFCKYILGILLFYRKTAMPTLWESLEEPDILDTTEFEYLFSKDTTQEKRKPLSETYEKKNKAKKVFLASLILLFWYRC